MPLSGKQAFGRLFQQARSMKVSSAAVTPCYFGVLLHVGPSSSGKQAFGRLFAQARSMKVSFTASLHAKPTAAAVASRLLGGCSRRRAA